MKNTVQEEMELNDKILMIQNLRFHKVCHVYLKLFGESPSILLSDLMSKYIYFRNVTGIDKEGFFYNTQENIRQDTNLSPKQQRRAIKILQEKEVLEIKFKGSPPKYHFKISMDKLYYLVKNLLDSSPDEYYNAYQRESYSREFYHKKEVTNLTKNLSKSNNDQREPLPKGTVPKGNINNTNKSLSKDKALLISKDINKASLEKIEGFSKEKPSRISSSLSSDDKIPFTENDIALKKRKSHLQKVPLPKPFIKLSPDIQEIFDYWTEMKLQRIPKIETKSYQNCIKKVKGLLNGRLFGKTYSIEKIQEVITTFSFAALDPQFEPASLEYKKRLSKTTIADFILNEFNKNGNASLFKQYLKEPPKTLKQFTPVEDKYPAVSNQIKKTYQEKILGGTKTEITSSDEDCFRRASNKLIDFFKNNEDKVALNLKNSDKVNLLFDSILKTVNENQVTITPGWLCSSTTINKRLPSYCFKQSVFQEGQRWSIYDKEENYDVLTVDDDYEE